MKKINYLLLLTMLVYCSSISQKSSSDEIIDYSAKKIATEILSNYSEKEKRTIGVASFSTEDLEHRKISSLGLFLANAIHNEMFNPKRYDLVERTQIDKLVEEFKGYMTGLYSETDTQKLALHGVNYLLIGSLQKRQDTIRVNARLVSIQTGKIVSNATQTMPTNASILSLYSTEKSNKIAEPAPAKVVPKKNTGSLQIFKVADNKLVTQKSYYLDDDIRLKYNQDSPFDTTEVELGFSQCNRGLYHRKSFNIYSTWKGFGFPADKPIALYNLLSDFNTVRMPNTRCYEVSIIAKDITLQKVKVKIKKDQYQYSYEEENDEEQ